MIKKIRGKYVVLSEITGAGVWAVSDARGGAAAPAADRVFQTFK